METPIKRSRLMRWRWPGWKTKQNPPKFDRIDCISVIEGVLDVQSGTWKFIHAWAASELDAARKRNDSLSVSPERTAAIRGEIRTLKRLANLPDHISSRDNRLKKSTPPDEAGGDDYDY
jgi:hypothetical protein